MLPIECIIGGIMNQAAVAYDNYSVHSHNGCSETMVPSVVLIQYRHAVVDTPHLRPQFLSPGRSIVEFQ